MATRRIGDATFDHGAQFVTARDPEFAQVMDSWVSGDIARVWYRSPAGHPVFRGAPSMTSFAKHLAGGLRVELGRQVVRIEETTTGWWVEFGTGERLLSEVVILTPPVPQTLDLLAAGRVGIPNETLEMLQAATYDRCLAVMALAERGPDLGPAGSISIDSGPVGWIADNAAKGVSGVPAVTIHASADFSERRWHDDRVSVGRELVRIAAPLMKSAVRDFQVHGWKFARPRVALDGLFHVARTSPRLVIAGDSFGGPRVEGAVLSGWAAAAALSPGRGR
jgi:predicted NAD/FAD-dependent oxidoreductase